MNRRAFFKMMVGGVAAAAAERTFPFRVFSFPSEPKIVEPVFDADTALFREQIAAAFQLPSYYLTGSLTSNGPFVQMESKMFYDEIVEPLEKHLVEEKFPGHSSTERARHAISLFGERSGGRF